MYRCVCVSYRKSCPTLIVRGNTDTQTDKHSVLHCSHMLLTVLHRSPLATHRHTDRPTDTQTDRQTDRQTH